MAGVGVFGVVCGIQSVDRVVRKTPKGPLHPAKCNRWAQHDGFHRETRGRDFAVLHEWNDAQSRVRDWKEVKRQETAIAKRTVANDGR